MPVRSGGLPIRIATKSVRVRAVIDAALRVPGYRGLLAFTLAEALWLAEDHDDIVLAYPTADRTSLARLLADEQAVSRITLMVDDESQLDFIDAVAAPSARPRVRIAIDADASWRAPALGRIGVFRSPLHSVEEVAGFARRAAERDGFRLVGTADVRGADRRAGRRHRQRRRADPRRAVTVPRGAASAAARASSPPCGRSCPSSSSPAAAPDPWSTPDPTPRSPRSLRAAGCSPGTSSTVTAPSIPHRRAPSPSTWCAGLRRTSPRSSAAAGSPRDRPSPPASPVRRGRRGCARCRGRRPARCRPRCGARPRAALRIGDRVWFRHAKSGEPAERIRGYHLVDGDHVVDELPTYRGEGKAFL